MGHIFQFQCISKHRSVHTTKFSQTPTAYRNTRHRMLSLIFHKIIIVSFAYHDRCVYKSCGRFDQHSWQCDSNEWVNEWTNSNGKIYLYSMSIRRIINAREMLFSVEYFPWNMILNLSIGKWMGNSNLSGHLFSSNLHR